MAREFVINQDESSALTLTNLEAAALRKLQSYVNHYGPEVGPQLYQVLQSQAGHASVGARLRRKLDNARERAARTLPLFPEAEPASSEPVPA